MGSKEMEIKNFSIKKNPSFGAFPNLGIEPRSPTLQADTLPSEPPGKPKIEFTGSEGLRISRCFEYCEKNIT